MLELSYMMPNTEMRGLLMTVSIWHTDTVEIILCFRRGRSLGVLSRGSDEIVWPWATVGDIQTFFLFFFHLSTEPHMYSLRLKMVPKS